MIIFPYSTALTLARPPWVTYATVALCVLVFNLQLGSGITDSLMYYPESWNPLKMITSALAHASWPHLIGNMVFYLAFAPAVEIMIASRLRYISTMLFISFVVGVCYSISILIGHSEPLPSLGFSGVVMGMVGLSAYLMPQARIKVFWWYIFFWKTFYVPVWILAVFYIGMDSWEMLSASSYGGVNLVAHVAGGFAGYAYGYLWLKDRKEDTQEELAAEIAAMKMEQQYGTSHSMSYRRNGELEQERKRKDEEKQLDRFMGKIYQAVTTHRDSEAMYLLMEQFDYLLTPVQQLEELFDRMEKWGGSRTLLCMGRLIIYRLHEERRYGRAFYYLEKCLRISPQFILPELSRTIFYAKMAIQNDRLDVARALLADAGKRYGDMVNIDLCRQLLCLINKT